MFYTLIIQILTLAISELGDKTQLVLLALSAKGHHKGRLVLAAFLGFVVSDGLAVLLGSTVLSQIPVFWVHVFAGLLFIFFGIQILREKPGNIHSMKEPHFFSLVGVFIISEMGDKSQLVTAALSGLYAPFQVFVAMILTLTLISVASVYAGKLLKQWVRTDWPHYGSGIMFLLVGIWMIIT